MVKFGFGSLEELMGFVSQHPEQEPAFWLALSTSDVYVITLRPFRDDGSRNYEELEIYTEKLLDGSERVPFFTTVEKLEKYNNGKSQMCKLNASDLFRKISGLPAVMNPGAEEREFSKVEVRDIITVSDDSHKNGVFGGVDSKAEIHYEKLGYNPEQLTKVIVGFLEKHDNVTRAFFLNMKCGDSERLLLIVETAGSYRKLFNELKLHVAKYLYQEPMMMLSYETELAREITQDVNPFYTKVAKHRTDLMSFD